MSQKDFLKKSMLKQLQMRHTKDLSDKLGNNHPLYKCQQVSQMKDILVAKKVETSFFSSMYLTIFKDETKTMRERKEEIRNIRKVNVDDIIDSHAEVTDILTDIKDTVQQHFDTELE